MEGVCSRLPLQTIRQAATIRLPPGRDICKPTTYAVISAIPGTYQVSIHNSCLCNEIVALHNRHLIDRSYIKFNKRTWSAALNYSLPELNKIECERTSIWEIAKSYCGGKRKQYLRACDMLEKEGYMEKDAILKMFVKPDKIPLGDISAKPPRAIQYRSPKYNLSLASYLKDFEHKFYAVSTGRSFVPDIAKGRNLIQRANDLIAKSECFNNPIFLNIDFSKMDSCVRLEHQRSIFRKCYLKKFPSNHLRKLLFAQLNNRGYSKHGIKYKIKGTRCSGDFTTGFENSLITWVIIRYILYRANIVGELYVDGDDTVVIMEKQDAVKFSQYKPLFEQCGFEAKFNWASSVDTVDFCQSRVILAHPPRMARNPLRALSNFNICLKNYPAKIWPRLIESKAICEQMGNPGIPILNPIGALFRTGVEPLFDKEQLDYLKLQEGINLDITDNVRVAYCNSWDITPYEQELIEKDPGVEFNSESYYELVHQKYQSLEATSSSF